jgi:hypothetical protein
MELAYRGANLGVAARSNIDRAYDDFAIVLRRLGKV